MKLKLHNRLSFKLILLISLILIVNFVLHTFLSINKLESDLYKGMSQNAYNISDLIKKSTRHSMLLSRNDDAFQIMNDVATEEGVEKIRLYNKSGKVIYSTDSTEINKIIDMDAEACIACHKSGTETLSDPLVKDKIRFYQSEGKRVIGLINPIENDLDCYTSECHAHNSSTELLGVLDVVLSLEPTLAIVETNTNNLVVNSVLITIVTAFFGWFFISWLITKPVKQISQGIEEIGDGNLDYKIDVSSKDELGRMAKQFNEMSERLNDAYNEIKDWNDTLNNKVNQKTEELKRVYEQVIQIEKLASLGKLSATVAHELNNPLAGILTYSKLISKKLNEIQKESEYQNLINYLNIISQESSRCGRIVKDLLLFSHRGENEFVSENLVDIVEKSIVLINHHLAIHKIKLNNETAIDNIEICADSQKIQQALLSLLINAIEAMSEGQTLKINVVADENNSIIRIIDQGHGISEADLPHIFEPFYSTKAKGQGTGLGLAVAYGIIEQHKGKIEVEKTSPEGTTFKVTLPLKKVNELNLSV